MAVDLADNEPLRNIINKEMLRRMEIYRGPVGYISGNAAILILPSPRKIPLGNSAKFYDASGKQIGTGVVSDVQSSQISINISTGTVREGDTAAVYRK
jgi:hypothetical protein